MAALRANLWLPSLGALLSPSSEGRASRNAPKLPCGRQKNGREASEPNGGTQEGPRNPRASAI